MRPEEEFFERHPWAEVIANALVVVLMFVALFMLVVWVGAREAEAHSPSEIESWESEWVTQMTEALELLTEPATGTEVLPADLDPYYRVRALNAELYDFQTRHACHFFDEGCPPPPVVVKASPPSASSPAPSPAPAPPGDVEAWRGLVSSFFTAADVDTALCLIWHESRGNPSAVNSSSGASGLFQHIPKYWDERSGNAGFGGASIFDPTANVGVAAFLRYRDGWHHWSPWNRGLCR